MSTAEDNTRGEFANSLSHFKVVKKLSDGKFSKVVLAETTQEAKKSMPTGEIPAYVAIKIIKQHDKPTISYQNYNSMTKIQNEIRIMRLLKKLHHPNILKLFNVITINKELEKVYQQNKVYMVLEYCAQGELSFNKLRSLDSIMATFRSIISAVEFLHLNNIIHRDIKPSNILINDAGQVKLSDFGISYKLSGDETVDQFQLGATLGTPLFMAPELCAFNLNGNTGKTSTKLKLGPKIDVWSIGVTFYWLLFHHFPYFSDNEFKLFNKIVNEPLEFQPMVSCPAFNNYTSHEKYGHGEKIMIFTKACELIEKMMHKSPGKRLSIDQLKSSDFVTYDLSDKLRKQYLKFNDPYVKLLQGTHSQSSSRDSSFGSLENAINRFMKRKKHHVPPPITIVEGLNSLERVLRRDQASSSSLSSLGNILASSSSANLVSSSPEFTNSGPEPANAAPDITPFVRQPGDDEKVSDLDDSFTSSEDSDFIASSSTHQIFAGLGPVDNSNHLNNSCFSLPLFDNRLSNNTIITTNSTTTTGTNSASALDPRFQFMKPGSGKLYGNGGSVPVTPVSPVYNSLLKSNDVSKDLELSLKPAAGGGLTRSKATHNLSKITASKGVQNLNQLLQTGSGASS